MYAISTRVGEWMVRAGVAFFGDCSDGDGRFVVESFAERFGKPSACAAMRRSGGQIHHSWCANGTHADAFSPSANAVY